MPVQPPPPATLVDLVAAYAQTAQAVLELGRSCRAEDFARHTECPGWTVQDQLSHVTALEALFAGEPEPPVELPELAHVGSDLARFMERGVHARRSWTGSEVVAELADLLPRRLATLADPSLTLDSVIDSTIGARPAGAFLALRVRDIWCHEQDLRVALGRPLALSTPGASHFTAGVLAAVPAILAREVHAPVGTSVAVEVTGPVSGTVFARVEAGRGGIPRGVEVAPGDVASAEVAPGDVASAESASVDFSRTDATITLSTEAFTRRGAGRRSVQDTPHTATGDLDLARAVLAHLAVTP